MHPRQSRFYGLAMTLFGAGMAGLLVLILGPSESLITAASYVLIAAAIVILQITVESR